MATKKSNTTMAVDEKEARKIKLIDIYKKFKKVDEKAPETIIKKIDDKFSIFLSIAKNISFVRQDIAKLVKLQGLKTTKTPDLFFQKEKEKENIYESRFAKQPTRVGETGTTVGKDDKKGPFDFISKIFSFLLKGGLLVAVAGGIGKLLSDPEIRNGLKNFIEKALLFVTDGIRESLKFIGTLLDNTKIKEGLVNAISSVFDFLKKGFSFIGDIIQDPKILNSMKDAFVGFLELVQKGIQSLGNLLQDERVLGAIVETAKVILNTIKDVVVKLFQYEVDTPIGKFSLGTILTTVIGSFAAFNIALDLAAAKLLGLGGVPGQAPSRPAPPSGRVPTPPTGSPTGTGAPTGKPTAPIPGEKPGFLKTPEEMIRERASRQAAEKGGKSALGKFLQKVMVTGPIGLAWGTALGVYEVMDYFAPDEQQQIADSIGVLISVQDDIDDINAGPGTNVEKQRRIELLKKRANFDKHVKKLEEYKKKASQFENKNLRKSLGLPIETTDESEAERKRLGLPSRVTQDAGAGRGFINPPTVIPSKEEVSTDTNGQMVTFGSLSREQQNAVLIEQRNREGFYPGSLAYDLNNPGAMLFSPLAAKYGAVPDPTRGVGNLKGKFARFPTLEAGTEAQRELWLSSRYANLPLDKAINLWTTGKVEGTGSPEVETYKKSIYAAINLPTPETNMPATQMAMASTSPTVEPTPTNEQAKTNALQLAKMEATSKFDVLEKVQGALKVNGFNLASSSQEIGYAKDFALQAFDKIAEMVKQPAVNNVTNIGGGSDKSLPPSVSSVIDDMFYSLINRTM